MAKDSERDIHPEHGRIKFAHRPRHAPTRAPRHYSRFIALLKLAMFTGAATLSGLVLAQSQMIGDGRLPSIGDLPKIELEGLSANQIDRATYYGTDRNNQPFVVTADSVRELEAGLKKIELDKPTAEITRADGSKVAVKAATGVYDQPKETLVLEGGVNMRHDKGYTLDTSAAVVQLGPGIVSGSGGVRGSGPFGQLRAERFRVENRGKVVHLLGKSQVIINGKDGAKP